MSDGIVFTVTKPLRINRDQVGRFLVRKGGAVEQRVREKSNELAERIRNATPVDTGSLQAGVTVTEDGSDTSSGSSTVGFFVRVSALEGASNIGSSLRLSQNREYATYVEARYSYVSSIVSSFR